MLLFAARVIVYVFGRLVQTGHLETCLLPFKMLNTLNWKVAVERRSDITIEQMDQVFTTSYDLLYEGLRQRMNDQEKELLDRYGRSKCFWFKLSKVWCLCLFLLGLCSELLRVVCECCD